MADQSKYILNRLFIAAPELQVDQALLKILFSQGLVSQDDLDVATKVRQKSTKYAGLAKKMRGKNLVDRLMLVVPEIMSVTTVLTAESSSTPPTARTDNSAQYPTYCALRNASMSSLCVAN